MRNKCCITDRDDLYHSHMRKMYSYLSITERKASLSSSMLLICFSLFFPSFCFFSSFIFLVMSPPYCKAKFISYDLYSQKYSGKLTHFAVTFFRKAFTLHHMNIAHDFKAIFYHFYQVRGSYVSLVITLLPMAAWIATSYNCLNRKCNQKG